MARPLQRGFTLVELLVVIAIIGVLMGLILPAVQSARESARRTQCGNNVRSLGQAAIAYETSKGEFPGFLQSFGHFEGGIDPTDPSGSPPSLGSHDKIGTWAVALLPQLDQQALYETWSDDRYPLYDGSGYIQARVPNVETFICPTDVMNDDEQFGRNSYASNNGYHPFVDDEESLTTAQLTAAFKVANGVFNSKVGVTGPRVTISGIRDSKSQTLLFTENMQADRWYKLNVDGTLPTGFGPGTVNTARCLTGVVWHGYDTDPPRWAMINGDDPPGYDRYGTTMTDLANSIGVDKGARPSSGHNQGVNAVFADGSLKFIDEEIDYRVYQALMTPRGKQSDVPFNEYVLDDDAF